MKQKKLRRASMSRVLAVLLALCLVLQCGILTGSANATSQNAKSGNVALQKLPGDAVSVNAFSGEDAKMPAENPYADTDVVRVCIVLEQPSTISMGYATENIASNASAMAYRASLEQKQEQMATKISADALNGEKLDVVWNLTLAANLISANVAYGQIESIQAVPGVKAVYLETVYETCETEKADAEINALASGEMTGTQKAWSAGYSGAGRRIAVIDTGADTDHQSFDSDAFSYALLTKGAEAVQDGKFKTVDAYIESLDLLDAAEIASVLTDLNAYKRFDGVLIPEDLYVNKKIAYGFNYVDASLDITHDNDTQGEHGSHVSGIATANSYIPTENGYALAAETVYAVGQAPEAQLITMKVFGQGGGAYDSDYMAAIEDAILLNCDSINLSLGSSNAGFTYSATDYFNKIFDSLAQTDTVVTISAGNSYSWPEYTNTGKLFADDVNTDRVGSPSTYDNSLSIASVDNNGFVGQIAVFTGSNGAFSSGVTEAGNTPEGYRNWTTLDTTADGSGTDYDYVFIGDPSALLDPDFTGENAGNYLGNPEDFEGYDLTGKIALVARGTLAFSDKHQNAALAGAAGVIIYNNAGGTISMDISASGQTIPCVTLPLADAKKLFAATGKDADGNYTGSVKICSAVSLIYGSETAPMAMSAFSSWGVPGDLSIKPEITAPGGNIYSVNGAVPGGTAYESMSGTSMAAPQVAGINALLMQYIQETGLDKTTGLSPRVLAQSLLISTAQPILETATGLPYSIRNQGAGLVNISKAISSSTYILVGDTEKNDGKVKAELGDDPNRYGVYSFDFTIFNTGDTAKTYRIDSDILAPKVISEGGNTYMDLSMKALQPAVRFITDRDPDVSLFYDFDGNGKVEKDDAQALLDLVSGKRDAVFNKENADLSGNGVIDAYDAHLLLGYIASGSYAPTVEPAETITVPAKDKLKVTVTVTLSEADRVYLDESFKNGSYVEGLIRLRSIADEEGAMDAEHSIPMLAFYGSWSEPSMFERGDYIADSLARQNGEAIQRYFSSEKYANYMVTRVNGGSYYYGMNLFAKDDAYRPERASLSNALGSSIDRIGYALLRNSAETRVVITDDATGEIYFDSSLGQQFGAFYHVNGSAWQSTSYNANVKWKGVDAKGAPLSDGTRATISLFAAPEYYRNAEGAIDWSSLKDGAIYSMPVLIDNQAPAALSATYTDDLLAGTGKLEVTVQDNHYTAAVLLLNANGAMQIKSVPVNQTEEGAAMTVVLDMAGIIGTDFILQAVDYAGNATSYKITIHNTGSVGSFYAFNTDSNSWVNFGMDVAGNETVLATPAQAFTAGAYAEGYLFAVDTGDTLYAIPMNDLSGKYNKVKTLYYSYVDLAYDTDSGILYGLRNTGNGSSYLYTISMQNGAERFLATVQADLKSFAAGNGVFYGITAGGDLCAFTENTLKTLYSLNCSVSGNQSTAYDGSSNTLYWANDTALLSISLADGTIQTIGELSSRSTCLCSSLYSTGTIQPSERVTGISLTGGEVETMVGNAVQLAATVRPWYASNLAVTWSSSDETVATVDANGLVQTVSGGSVTITATSVLSPEISASTSIKVVSLDKTVSAAMTMNGAPVLYQRDLSTGTGNATALSGVGGVYAATYDTENKALWIMDDGGVLYNVDEATGETLKKVPSASSIVAPDIEYSQLFGGFWSIYGSYLLVPTGFEENAPGSGFNFAETMAQYTGGTSFIGVTSTGKMKYQGKTCERLILIDNVGAFWQVLVYQNGSNYGAYLSYGSTGLAGKIISSQNNALFFDPTYGTDGGVFASIFNGSGSTTYIMNAANTMSLLELWRTNSGDSPVAFYNVNNIEADKTEASFNVQPIDATLSLTTLTAAQIDAIAKQQASETQAVRQTQAAQGAEIAEAPAPTEEEPAAESCVYSAKNGVVTLTVNAKAPTVGGKITIAYDNHVLTFTGADAAVELSSANHTASAVSIAYASLQATDGQIVKLTFTYNSETAQSTKIAFNASAFAEGIDEGKTESETIALTLPQKEAEAPAPTEPEDCPCMAFTDLILTEWYHEAVEYALQNGLMVGVSKTAFAPNGTATRAMFLAVLARSAEIDTSVYTSSDFEDVKIGEWYGPYVAWASENEIAFGYGDGTFHPNDPITREEMVAILYRFAEKQGVDVTANASALEQFDDADAIKSWAKDAFAWAAANGIIHGSGNKLTPGDTATRAQIATVIMNYEQI